MSFISSKYRGPGGRLSKEGQAEMYRRFRANQRDIQIAREMGITPSGVCRRRTMYLASAESYLAGLGEV